MTTTTHYAAIDATGSVYGLGTTPNRAIAAAMRAAGVVTDCEGTEWGGRDSYRAVRITPAAVRYVRRYGGAPSTDLSVPRSGAGIVCLTSEEES